MKPISIVFAFALLFSTNLGQAQNSSYKKSACDSYAKKHCNKSSAALAASLDKEILSVFDADSYQKKYVRKVECSMTGSVRYEDVKFDRYSGAFVSKKYCEPSDWYKCVKKGTNCIVQCLQSDDVQESLAAAVKKERT